MRPDARVIAELFGLGAPLTAPAPLAGGSSSGRWRLDTDGGRWMVKLTEAPQPWQLHEMEVSGRLERAAFAAGVPMPRLAPPGASAVGLWTPMDHAGGSYVRVSEWVDGAMPSASDTALLAGWLGRTLATIDGLHLPGDPTVEAAYVVHDVAQWRGWLDEAVHAELLNSGTVAGLWPAVRDGTALVQAAMAAGPVFQLAHRDVSVHNILLTAAGPLLLDFDYAGPEVSWWEFVHHAFDLSNSRLGHEPPAPGVVRAALAAYTAAGATHGPANPEAFAGMMRSIMSAIAYNVWIALGHRPADAARRAFAAQVARNLAEQLPLIVRSIDSWTGLIA
jgi:Ser/Thr protein kinase RdoA (MazF antagonist)